MNLNQCDNCRVTSPPPSAGWLVVSEIEGQSNGLFGTGISSKIAGMFCTCRCLAEYATARALVIEAEESDG